MNRFLICIFILIMGSCIPDQNNNSKTANSFYDINGLIDEQIKLLDSISPSIVKTAIIGTKEEVTEITPIDSVAWSKELMLFKSCDINRSILRDSYDVKENTTEESILLIYTSKYPEKTVVEKLSIKLNKEDHNPEKLHATIDSKNELFNSVKTLELVFEAYNSQQVLSAYQTEGWQKMISKDSTFYLIKAEIVFP